MGENERMEESRREKRGGGERECERNAIENQMVWSLWQQCIANKFAVNDFSLQSSSLFWLLPVHFVTCGDGGE